MSGARILVVDDEELIRWSLAERMGAEGHDVLKAGNGAQPLECACELTSAAPTRRLRY